MCRTGVGVFIFDDDSLTYDENKYCEHIIEEMSDVPWVQSLLKKIIDLKYPRNSKVLKSALFELEIAYENGLLLRKRRSFQGL